MCLRIIIENTIQEVHVYIIEYIGESFLPLKVQTCPPHQLYVCLVMDEMHIKEDLVYNKHTGELIGYTNLGEMNTHLLSLEKSLEGVRKKAAPLAKSLFVLMVRGLFSSLEFPYAQFPCSNLTGNLIFDIFWEAVERLERYDFNHCGM